MMPKRAWIVIDVGNKLYVFEMSINMRTIKADFLSALAALLNVEYEYETNGKSPGITNTEHCRERLN